MLEGHIMFGIIQSASSASLLLGPLTLQEEYQEALDMLLLAEEAFELCNPKHLEMVDNVGLLMIDIVW